MPRYLNLDIPTSCNENWQNMLPASGGRHCVNCQKKVIDFTGMTDAELTAYFRSVDSPTCGRFTESQLKRDILIPRKPIPWLKYFFQFTLPAFLLSLKANSQVLKVINPTETIPFNKIPGDSGSVEKLVTVTGVITDADGKPLPGASVVIKDRKKGTISDSIGNFHLQDVDPSEILTISYIGYDTQQVLAASLQHSSTVQLHSPFMGEVVVVGYTISAKSTKKKLKEIKKQEEITPSVLAYPNPIISGNKLNIQCRSMEQGAYKVQLFTLFGQLVQNNDLDYVAKEKAIAISTAGIQPGTYLLRLQHQKTGRVLSQQVVLRN